LPVVEGLMLRRAVWGPVVALGGNGRY